MIITSTETRKISYQNNFTRTHQQEHNGQLYILLIQLKEALELLLPPQIIRHFESNSNTNNNNMNNINSDLDESKAYFKAFTWGLLHHLEL